MDVPALMLNILGFIATTVAIVMWVPQARTTWGNRNDALKLAGVSEATQWLSATSYLLWGFFGAFSMSFWVMAPSIVSFPLSIATIIVVRRSRRLPGATRSTPIILMTEPSSPVTAFVPTTTESLAVISTATVSTPILSTLTGSISTVFTSPEFAVTASIPVVSTRTAPTPVISTTTGTLGVLV